MMEKGASISDGGQSKVVPPDTITLSKNPVYESAHSKANASSTINRLYLVMYQYVKTIKIQNEKFLHGHEITPDFRKKMVNWLCEVIRKCQLSDDTYFQAVQIMDKYFKYCSTCSIHLPAAELQIIGVCSLFIANKYNDYKNMTSDFIVRSVLHNKHKEDEVLDWETKIFKAIQSKLGTPNERTFIGLLTLILKEYITDKASSKIEEQSQKNLHSYKLSQKDPELLAAGTIYTCSDYDSLVLAHLIKTTGFCKKDIESTAKEISEECKF